MLQTITTGADRYKPSIVNSIQNIFKPKGIYERNDVPVRQLEGLDQRSGFLTEPFDTMISIEEHGLKYEVDIANGQKTGYYLDRSKCKSSLKNIVNNAEVLDVFCYTGSFALYAAKNGARSIHGIDISKEAIKQATTNAILNDLSGVTNFQEGNAFDLLKLWAKEKKQYDIVILDPPAFTNNKSAIEKAINGYKEINLRAIQLLKKGGFLVTTSSTSSVSGSQFIDTILSAAKDAKKQIQQIDLQTQTPDHPILLQVATTSYLKFYIFQIK